jgi:DNA-binding transcriptional ArsR family regulator
MKERVTYGSVLVLAALADPVRREIVEVLAGGEVGAGEIAARFPVTRPAVSRHLRVLREAGLVSSEIQAQRRVYRLERAALAELDAWLDRFRPLHQGRDPDARAERALPGPAGRLDVLDTEIRRGWRRPTPDNLAPDNPAPENGDTHDDRSAG